MIGARQPFAPVVIDCGTRTFVVQELGLQFFDEIHEIEKESFRTPWSREMLLAEFSHDFAVILGLLADSELIAYAVNHLVAGELHILTFAVKREFRRQHLGKLLLSKVLQYGVSEGARVASLEVRASNAAAQELYLKAGFTRHSIRRHYYADTGEDALVLERDLRNLREDD